MLVNHKRVARIMHDDNLIAATHEWPSGRRGRIEIHVNLAGRMKVIGTNQLCVADITYVRLNREFVYLAVVLDKFSRRVVGWALDRTLNSRLPLAALTNTLKDRNPGPGLVHHSDRGVQYLQANYVATLRKYCIVASVSRPASPGDNANCESFFRTLKRKEIRATEYANVEDLCSGISRFIDSYCNRKRLHFEKVAMSAGTAGISSVRLDVLHVIDITFMGNVCTRQGIGRMAAVDVYLADETRQPKSGDMAKATTVRDRSAWEFGLPAAEQRQ
jgi:hypothetical protein